MEDYRIDVAKVEEYQMIQNRDMLDKYHERAKSAIVNGASVHLFRGKDKIVFDTITTLEDLESYFDGIFKYWGK